MNKFAKGALAGGLGIALLLGGGATLAYWNDDAAVSGQSVTSGHLQITPVVGSSQWSVAFNGGTAKDIADITAFNMVPGDLVTYTADFEIDAEGDNLLIDATTGAAALTGDAALISRLAVDTEISLNGGAAAAGPVRVVDGNTITVVVTIDWPFGDSTSPALDNLAMDDAVNFANFNVVVTQVAS